MLVLSPPDLCFRASTARTAWALGTKTPVVFWPHRDHLVGESHEWGDLVFGPAARFCSIKDGATPGLHQTPTHAVCLEAR